MADALPDHRLLIVDRPGYGASGAGTLSMEANADRARPACWSARAQRPATVVGHSYGGGIAILLAAHHPEVVSGLVLVASVGRADNVTVVDRVLAAPGPGACARAPLGLFTLGRVPAPLRRLAGDGAVTKRAGGGAPALPDSTLRRGDVSTGRAVVAHLRGRAAHPAGGDRRPSKRALPAVHTPTAVLSGEWDVVVPPPCRRGGRRHRRQRVGAACPELGISSRATHPTPWPTPCVGWRPVAEDAGRGPRLRRSRPWTISALPELWVVRNCPPWPSTSPSTRTPRTPGSACGPSWTTTSVPPRSG